MLHYIITREARSALGFHRRPPKRPYLKNGHKKDQSTAMIKVALNHDLNMKIGGGKKTRTGQNRDNLSYI